MGDKIVEAIHKHYDNSYENIGNYNSFTWYVTLLQLRSMGDKTHLCYRLGPLWAQASTAPSRLFKGFPSEGGILVPCVFKPPTKTFLPSFSTGSFNRSFTTVMDWAPTFLELAGITLPASVERQNSRAGTDNNVLVTQSMTTFRGKDVHAIKGKSWIPLFGRGKKTEDEELWHIHSSSEPVGWELFARAAMRKGDWKIVHIEKSKGGAGEADGSGWELFNVVDDPGETRDLAQAQPEKLAELLQCWDQYVVECGIVWGENAFSAGLSREEAPQLWDDEIELQKSWMGAAARAQI
jgi:arylsulfatase A-like enzyme